MTCYFTDNYLTAWSPSFTFLLKDKHFDCSGEKQRRFKCEYYTGWCRIFAVQFRAMLFNGKTANRKKGLTPSLQKR